MKRLNPHLVLAGLYTLAGAVFVVLSGSAEGLVSPRILGAFFAAVIAAVHSVYLAWIFIFSFFISRMKILTLHTAPIAGMAVFAACHFWGFKIDDARTQETKRIGEEVLSEIGKFKAANGACPESLESMGAFSNGVPKPSLHDSKFWYFVYHEDKCVIEFPGPLFIACRRGTEDSDWLCDD